jgi:cellulose synthase/poly-beta-1,6-N-acetylglucosamine synthase-like glycosyltransferase
MIDIIITSYKEPKSTLRAINKFLEQKLPLDYRIIVVDPFPEVRDFLKTQIKNKNVGFFLDPGEGKSYALNLLFTKIHSKNKDDIILLTDGDVYVSDNTISRIIEAFKDKEIGCVTAHPVALDSRTQKYGYWSHLAFDGIDKARRKLSDSGKFFECSGFLFAIRQGVISEFPLDGSEDGIIPYLFWKKGYKIKYLPDVNVYVKNPGNWHDYLAQKIRNVKGHENYSKLYPDMPRTKSFWNEVKFGWYYLFTFPKSLVEFWWTIQLYFARLYLYYKAFKDIKKEKMYSDGWREVETPTTKTLD